MRLARCIQLLLICLLVTPNLQAQSNWSVNLLGIGTFSSPRATDLNGDAVKNIILGAGQEELTPSDSAIVALGGATGELLWHVSAWDQVFGSVALLDINRDGGWRM